MIKDHFDTRPVQSLWQPVFYRTIAMFVGWFGRHAVAIVFVNRYFNKSLTYQFQSLCIHFEHFGRKEHLHVLCASNQLRGIGGPGAPHVYAFDRLENLQIDPARVNSHFWQKLGVPLSSSDVIVRPHVLLRSFATNSFLHPSKLALSGWNLAIGA